MTPVAIFLNELSSGNGDICFQYDRIFPISSSSCELIASLTYSKINLDCYLLDYVNFIDVNKDTWVVITLSRLAGIKFSLVLPGSRQCYTNFS